MKKIFFKALFFVVYACSVNAQVLSLVKANRLNLSASLDHQSYYNSGVAASGLSFGASYNSNFLKLSSFALVQSRDGLEESFNFTQSVQEAYFKVNLINGHRLKFGRAFFNESEHGELELSGLWNNSWDFRKDNPLQEGLFGAFYEGNINSKVSFKVFSSPVSLPKLTQHFDFDDQGSISSTTPWFNLPPSSIKYSNQDYNVNYFLQDLDYADLVVKPQFGINTKIKDASLSYNLLYLYAPSKELDLGLSFLVNPKTPEVPIDLTISPETPYMHKLGFEGVKDWSNNQRTTVSVSGQIRQDTLPVDINTSWVGLDDGVYSFIAHEFKAYEVKAKVFATLSSMKMNSNGELDNILRDSLSINYRFSNGIGANFKKNFNSKTKVNLFSYFDVKNQGALFRFSVSTQRQKLGAQIGVSFIEALNNRSTGFYKDFRENDQIYTRLSYAF